MQEHMTLGEMHPAQRKKLGWGIMALSVCMGVLVAKRPEAANAPLWIIWLACAAFAFAGAAIATYSSEAPRRYRWSIVAMLACMTAIPTWIALGSGERSCMSNIARLSSEVSCRLGFGAGAAVLVVMLAIALRQALKSQD